MPQGRDSRGRFTSKTVEPTKNIVVDELTGSSKDDLANDLDSDPAIIAAKLELAEEAAEYWRSIAPVGDPAVDPHSGAYRDSIHVEQKGDKVYVVASDPKAHWIEYGTEHMPEYAPRQRTETQFNE